MELATFLGLGKNGIIGYKSEKDDATSKIFLNFIWCKVCARSKDRIANSPSLTGSAKASAHASVNGTNGVTKHQVRPRSHEDGTGWDRTEHCKRWSHETRTFLLLRIYQ